MFVQLHLYEKNFKTTFYRFVRFIRKEQGSMEEFRRDCCIRGYHDIYGYIPRIQKDMAGSYRRVVGV